ADTEVMRVIPESGGYRLEARTGTFYGFRAPATFHAKKVLFSAGALGTNALLLRCQKDPESLPKLSPQLGHRVRTNSESLIMVTVPGTHDDHSKGIAINSLLQTDEHSHLEMVRYGSGSGFFRLVMVPHVGGRASGFVKLLRMMLFMLLHPLRCLRVFFVARYSETSMIL